MRDIKFILIFWVWGILSFATSAEKSSSGNCWKKFQVDYILFTNLFCEIEGEKRNE